MFSTHFFPKGHQFRFQVLCSIHANFYDRTCVYSRKYINLFVLIKHWKWCLRSHGGLQYLFKVIQDFVTLNHQVSWNRAWPEIKKINPEQVKGKLRLSRVRRWLGAVKIHCSDLFQRQLNGWSYWGQFKLLYPNSRFTRYREGQAGQGSRRAEVSWSSVRLPLWRLWDPTSAGLGVLRAFVANMPGTMLRQLTAAI